MLRSKMIWAVEAEESIHLIDIRGFQHWKYVLEIFLFQQDSQEISFQELNFK